MSGDLGYLPRLESRKEFVDYLEGYPVSGVTDLEQPDRDRKLLKTYMLETACCNRRMPDLANRFADHVRLHRLDDTLFRVEDTNHNGEVVGLIEELNSRHPVLYTKMAVEHSERWVRQVVDRSPWLDRVWLSSPILFQLWKQVQATVSPHRYARLYRNITESVEKKLWLDTTDAGAGGYRISGSPLTIEFGQPLSETVFNRFVELAFQSRGFSANSSNVKQATISFYRCQRLLYIC